MKAIRIILLCMAIWYLYMHKVKAQDTLKISVEQAESRFLDKNLQLLAERCRIDIADAAIIQTKLLNNPAIEVSGINFWYPKASEELGLTSASFGNKIIFSAQLEQMIRTAGKRRKLVNMEKISKEVTVYEFEAFLLGLKTELRITLYEIIYLQSYQNMVQMVQKTVSDLVESYKIQSTKGNIAKSELIRLQSSLIELEAEANELQCELNKQWKAVKILLNITPETEILMLNSEIPVKNPDEIFLEQLLEKVKSSHPEFILSDLNAMYYEKLLLYEKAQRSPDVSISLNYDRYSGVWKNFVGIGVNVDIPVFNRNQGNIKMAKLQIEQSNYNAKVKKNTILQEIVENYRNYKINFNFYQKLTDVDFSDNLENMFEVFLHNFQNRNINILEYIDFIYAYKTTKQAILIAKKNLNTSFSELQFSANNMIN